jgi:hypothetical protein
MDKTLETTIFWLGLAIISGWVLKKFYFSKNAALLWQLRVAAVIFIFGVFILLFFPWLPEAYGGPTGWGIILQGDTPMVILAGLLFFYFGDAFYFSQTAFV